MTLATHAITGAAIASFLPHHPVLGFTLGFASHFALDMIPHRDYPIRSASVDPSLAAPMKCDREFLIDLLSIGSDAIIGIILALVIFAGRIEIFAVLLGALGGIMPDGLQFLYARIPREPLVSLQRFHVSIHTKHRFESSIFWGAMTQIAFVCLVVVAARYFFGAGLL